MIERQKLQVDLAHKDFYPDFNLQYMWQRTDPTQYRAYYMLTFGVRVPIYRGRNSGLNWRRPKPISAVLEANSTRNRNRCAVELRTEYDTAQEDRRTS